MKCIIGQSEYDRLKEIEHRVWHVFDELCDDGSDTYKLDKEIVEDDLNILHQLLPIDHPEKTILKRVRE